VHERFDLLVGKAGSKVVTGAKTTGKIDREVLQEAQSIAVSPLPGYGIMAWERPQLA